MAVTELLSQTSKKSKHTSNSNISRKNSSRDPSDAVSQDDWEKDLDRPQFKRPSQSKRSTQEIPGIHSANGNDTDSETDIDKPVKRNVTTNSVPKTDYATKVHNSQTVHNHDDNNSESEDEPLSMSLLEPYGPRRLATKSSELSFRSSQKNESTHAGSAIKMKVQRRPISTEMSSSEYESNSEGEVPPNRSSQLKSDIKNKSAAGPHLHTQQEQSSESDEESEYEEKPSRSPQIDPQRESEPEEESESEEQEEPSHPVQTEPQSESEPEEEEEPSHPAQTEPQRESESDESNDEPNLNHSVRVKEEAFSPEISFMEDDNTPDREGTIRHPEEFLTTHEASGKSASSTSQQAAAALSEFMMNHSLESAPVVDIPPDSSVWVLQIPRSISADQLQGRRLSLNKKGDKILNLPSGRWQILEQKNAASENVMSCIVSTGNLSYKICWLQPKTFWFLKRVSAPISMEGQELQLRKEITPLPIEDLLKMKTNAYKRKFARTLKRVRDLSPIQLSENLKSEISEGDSSNLHSPRKKKKKKRENTSANEESSIMDDSSTLHSPRKKKKKEIQNSSANEESPVMDPDTSRASSKHKKHKHHSAMDTTQENMSSVIQGSITENERKRKRSVESDAESPQKKKKKKLYSQASDLVNLHSESADASIDAEMSIEDSSMRKMKKEKKKKHKEKTNQLNKIKQEKISSGSSDEERGHTNILGQQDDGTKLNKHKNLEQSSATVETSSGTNHQDMRQSRKKEKRKEKKHGNKESSENEETFHKHEGKDLIDLLTSRSSDIAEEFVTKKNKKRKHFEENREETLKENKTKTKNEKVKKNDDSHHHTEEDNGGNLPVIKKKKKKHKSKDVENLNRSKIKQEKEDFWERETSPEFLSRLYLTQIAPDDDIDEQD